MPDEKKKNFPTDEVWFLEQKFESLKEGRLLWLHCVWAVCLKWVLAWVWEIPLAHCVANSKTRCHSCINFVHTWFCVMACGASKGFERDQTRQWLWSLDDFKSNQTARAQNKRTTRTLQVRVRAVDSSRTTLKPQVASNWINLSQTALATRICRALCRERRVPSRCAPHSSWTRRSCSAPAPAEPDKRPALQEQGETSEWAKPTTQTVSRQWFILDW